MGNYRRLPLEGLANARELGGFPCPEGLTAFGRYLRSEVPARLSESDFTFFKEYGLKTVIDFRGGEEIAKTADVLSAQDWITYIHLPVFDENVVRGAAKDMLKDMSADFTWGKHYVQMAEEKKDWVKTVLETIAASEGVVLFHCTTGKDRTGIISAVLLGLCGVSESDIAADYCVSEIYLRDMFKAMSKYVPVDMDIEGSNPFLSTKWENMVMLLEYISRTYGGMAGYVRECGVAQETVDIIRGRFIEA